MRHLLVPLPLLGALCACTPAAPPEEAPPGVPEREDVALTVYNAGRALVKDTRSFDLDQGSNSVRFDEVTSGIIPGSVQVAGQSGSEVAVLEQNFATASGSGWITPRL